METESEKELTAEPLENENALPEHQSGKDGAFLKIKFNHEELSLDELTAKELAQKGLNYDKLKARLDELTGEKGKTAEEPETDTDVKTKLETLEKQLTLLETELKKEQENRNNAGTSASPVGAFGTVSEDGLYTEEQLNSLSPSEIRKNLDKALRSMSFFSKHKK